ncbi:hypothetical protein DFH06DRAFT_1227251 [Mycena polygramma]|nr:hypothetical protein DFH06DRAFT_1227251 [Mycena polygramma]
MQCECTSFFPHPTSILCVDRSRDHSGCSATISWLPKHESPPAHQYLPVLQCDESSRGTAGGLGAVQETYGILCGQWVRPLGLSTITPDSIIAFTSGYLHVPLFCGPTRARDCRCGRARRSLPGAESSNHSFGRTRRRNIHGAVDSSLHPATRSSRA